MNQEFTIREYITQRLRIKFAVLVVGASSCAIILYFLINYQINRRQLTRSIEVSRQVLGQALEAGDFNLATTYLRATINQQNFYSIELRDKESHSSVLGPAVAAQHRYFEICDEKDLDSKFNVGIYACRRLIGFPEIGLGFSALMTLILVLAWCIRFINNELMDWSDHLSELLEKLSQLELERFEEAKTELEQAGLQVKEVRILRRRILEILTNSKNLIEYAAMSRIATQVAHDIRSPLAALEVAAANIAQLSENKRILIRSAVSRISDISNNLLERYRTQVAKTGDLAGNILADEKASPQLLSDLIEMIVREKRFQFSENNGVRLEFILNHSSFGVFANVQPIEFKRLLSNLINNAFEAFDNNNGSVAVSLYSIDGYAQITVHDNGKGISSEVLAKLGRSGETHGKASGSGLGLSHAHACANSWGGRLDLSSKVEMGTSATLSLPKIPAPAWFVQQINLKSGQFVVILDDDASIHQVWYERLEAIKAESFGIKVAHVSTPTELRSWIKSSGNDANNALYLFDYELTGYQDTGASLAMELALQDRVILVTSHCEEASLSEDSLRLKARMIPKGLVPLIPIDIDPATQQDHSRERLDAVLIDDDPLVRNTWKISADRAGKNVMSFGTVTEFLKISEKLDTNTPIYIDAELDNGIRGDAESGRIHKLGFGEIYLATGHNPEGFASLPHLRAIVGKTPPWMQSSLDLPPILK